MKIIFLTSLLLIASFVPVKVAHAQTNVYKVLSVVDGDTISVDIRGKKEVVRLLGIDTPETKDPRKSVQCFGLAATEKMKSFVLNQSVILVDDSTQGNRDKYKRLLRYVYLNDSKRTFVNGEMVKQGYAFSYREYPTKMLNKLNSFEVYARENNLGLWSACVTPTASKNVTSSKAVNVAPRNSVTKAPVVKKTMTVQGTTGGDKDCGDFSTHAQAQAFFLANGGPGSDPHKLDADHDGDACETLP